MTRTIEYLRKPAEAVCCLLLWIMTGATFAQVVYRYVFGRAFAWSDELAIWSMVWMIMLGAAVNSIKGSHARIDFFISYLPRTPRFLVEIADQLICAGIIVLISVKSTGLVSHNLKNISAGLKLPTAILYGSVVAGGLLIAVFFVAKAYLYGRAFIKGEEFLC